MGLLYDALLPGLGDYMQGNRDRRDQISRRQALTQEEILDGAPAASTMQQGADGLITGVSTPGSGLMQNPNDFNTQRRYGLGLMGNEYTAGLGEDYLRQINAEHIAQPAAQMLAQESLRRFNINQGKEALDKQLAEQKVLEDRRLADQASTKAFRNDFDAKAKPYRKSVEMFESFQTMAQNRGSVENWSLIDDVASIKTYAKMVLGDEAVMNDDQQVIAVSSQLSQGVRTMINQAFGAGTALTPNQRRQLAQSIAERAGGALQNLQQEERNYQGYADTAGLLRDEIVGQRQKTDTTRYAKPPVRDAAPNFTEDEAALQQSLDEQHAQENPQWFDPLVSGWRELRR
jgi:hypothetical protein